MDAIRRRIPAIIYTEILDNTPHPIQQLLYNPHQNAEPSQQVKKQIKTALRVLMVYERLGWMGIFGRWLDDEDISRSQAYLSESMGRYPENCTIPSSMDPGSGRRAMSAGIKVV
jgi:hypothetical protein